MNNTMKWSDLALWNDMKLFFTTRDVSYKISSLCNPRCQRHTGLARWESKAPVSSSDVSICIWMYLVHFPCGICPWVSKYRIRPLHGVQKSRLEYQNARLRKDLKSMTRFIDSSVLLAAALQTWLRGAVAAQITIHLCHFVQSRHNRTFWKRGHSNIPLIKRKATEERKRHRKNTLNYWVALQKHWTFTDVHWHFHFHLRREETFLFACSRGNDMNTKRWEFQHTRPSHDFQHTTNTAHSLHGPRVARGADPAAVHALIRHGHRVHLRTIQASEGQFVSVTILCVSFHHFFKFVTNVTNV